MQAAFVTRLRDSWHKLKAWATRLLPSHLVDAEGVEDLIQSALLVAWRDRDKFAGSSNSEWEHWLYSILHHRAFNLRNRQQRFQRLLNSIRSSETTTGPPADEQLTAFLAALSEFERTLLVMRFVDGKSWKELGHQFSVAPDMIRMRCQRALANLRQRMANGTTNIVRREQIRERLVRQTITLCMITRNEEDKIAACLRPFAEIVDEILIVDCGSTDRTREIAIRHGARVIEHIWTDSFADARNQWFLHASGEWIFWLDADESLDPTNLQGLRKLLDELPADNIAFLMRQRSLPSRASMSDTVVDQIRLFRRQPGIAWRYRVHEQIQPSLKENGAQIAVTDITITHTGYQSIEAQEPRLRRNMRLLEISLGELPDDPFVHFNIGMTSLPLFQQERARVHLLRCIELASPRMSFVAKAYLLLCQIHRSRGELEQAQQMNQQARQVFPSDPELGFEAGLIHLALHEFEVARACFESVIAAPLRPRYSGLAVGIRGHLSHYFLGQIAFEQNRLHDAEKLWRKAVRHNPGYGPAWWGLAELYRMQGRTDQVETMVKQLEAHPQTAIIARVLRARVLMTQNDSNQARDVLEVLIRDYPEATWPRIVLCEMLIHLRLDYTLAGTLVREIEYLDSNLQPTCRRLENLRQSSFPAAMIVAAGKPAS